MSRVYIVTDSQTSTKTLVEADTQHQAVGMVVSGRYSATPASAKEVMDAMSAGAGVMKKAVAVAADPQAAEAPAEAVADPAQVVASQT